MARLEVALTSEPASNVMLTVLPAVAVVEIPVVPPITVLLTVTVVAPVPKLFALMPSKLALSTTPVLVTLTFPEPLL